MPTISLSEDLVPLSLAARETPSRDGTHGVAVTTVWRWTMRGIRGVRLETLMVGGIRMTSREAMSRFFARLTAAANGESAPIPTDRQRAKAVAAANRDLDAAGI